MEQGMTRPFSRERGGSLASLASLRSLSIHGAGQLSLPLPDGGCSRRGIAFISPVQPARMRNRRYRERSMLSETIRFLPIPRFDAYNAGLHSWYRLVPFSIFISHEAGGNGREERIRERGFEIETEKQQRETAASQRRVYRRGRDDAFSCLILFSIAPSERKRERPSTLAAEDSTTEKNFTLPQERRTSVDTTAERRTRARAACSPQQFPAKPRKEARTGIFSSLQKYRK